MSPWPVGVSRLLLGAALAACTAGELHAEPAGTSCGADSRCLAVRNFFLRYESPLEKMAVVFLRAADENRLDWRLLPAISMVESSGGKHGIRQNVFGWDSGKTRFASVEAGIAFVAQRLARAPIYAGQSTLGILRRYNPARQTYPPKVTRFMLELSGEAVE